MDSVAPRYPSEDINYTFKNISFCWLHWFCFLARPSVLKFGACFTVWFLWNVWWVLVTCSSYCILRLFSDLHVNADSVLQSQMPLLVSRRGWGLTGAGASVLLPPSRCPGHKHGWRGGRGLHARLLQIQSPTTQGLSLAPICWLQT